MTFTVVLEPKIGPHAPDLYRADWYAGGVDGWEAVGEEQVDAYRRDGFLVVRGGFTVEEMETANRELREMQLSEDPQCDSVYYEGTIRDELNRDSQEDLPEVPRETGYALGDITDQLPNLPPETRARYVRKLMGFVQHHPPLDAIAHKKELIDLTTRLLGEPVQLFQDMAMIKPPGGREKPWHQDHAYFNLPLDAPVLGVWISLGSSTVENGCMHVLAGGHLRGPRLHFMRRDWQLCDSDLGEEVQTAVPMEAGDILFFDSKLPHGTPTNHTNSQRWAIQFHYATASAIKISETERLAVFGAEGKGVSC
ncbi:MAG: phytanoyl-CoA dioxygenase family protein [Candidatus Omnitrophica bacterium]|nr:phytanoyl-CoA dioxygenase family protein [Candidatus Omnitrophota bacterium]